MADNLASAQDLVAVEKIERNTVVLKDGSFRKILMVSGVNFSLKSQTEQEMITGAYQNFLNSLDFPIQIIVHSRKINIQKYLDDLEKRREAELSPLLQNQIAEYRDFVGKFVEENAIMEKTFLVSVPWYPPVAGKKATAGAFSKLPFFGKKRGKEAPAAAPKESANLVEELPQLDQRVDQIIEGLFAIGIEAIVLSDEQLVELFYNFYNPGSVERTDMNIPKAQ